MPFFRLRALLEGADRFDPAGGDFAGFASELLGATWFAIFIDIVQGRVSANPPSGFDNVIPPGTTPASDGNSDNNLIVGDDADNGISGRAGNDRMFGNAGNDIFIMSNGEGESYGQDHIDGGAGVDTVDFGTHARSPVFVDLSRGIMTGGGSGGAGGATLVDIENVNGGAFNDRIIGTTEDNFLFGFSGNDYLYGGGGQDRLDGAADDDTLVGAEGNDNLQGGAGDDSLYGGFEFATSGPGTGNDTLTGHSGRDVFVFNDNPNPFISSSLATADRINDFVSRTDILAFDDAVFPHIGAFGHFQPGDERFFAAGGATGGSDESDRVVYDTSTGRLYYDPDGSGAIAAQLIATLADSPAVVASDIAVV